MISVSLDDKSIFRKLQAFFNPRGYEDAMSRAIEEIARFSMGEIKGIVPTRSRTLRNRMRIRRVNMFHYDIAETYYGKFVRGGTASPIYPKHKKVLRFIGVDGGVVFRSFVNGQPPNDYVREAIDANIGKIEEIASKHGFDVYVE